MELTVNMAIPTAIEIGATGLQGLAQEIRTVLSTRKGSVPLDRNFGLSWEVVDSPLPQVLPLIIAEIVDAIERDVPRVCVKDVQFGNALTDTMDGRLLPIVTVEIREEYIHEFR